LSGALQRLRAHGRSAIPKEATMNMHGWAAVCIAALASGGCATLDGPEARANAAAQKQECKLVAYSSTAERLRAQNQADVPGTDMQKTEGRLDVGSQPLRDSPQLRESRLNPVAMATRLQQDC
jgi:hypothetical protein